MFPVTVFDFCCGTGNLSDGTCDTATQGSRKSFPVPAGFVIDNRTSGSTSPNDTLSTSTVTTTLTARPSASPVESSSSSTEPAIGAGVGVPLGVALLGSLGLLWGQRGCQRSLKRKVEAWEEKYEALAKSEGVEYRHDVEERNYQLRRNGKPNELDDSQASRVFEMGGLREGAA